MTPDADRPVDDFGVWSDPCAHDWKRAGRIGLCIVYECRLCGEEYERDVS